MSARRRAPRPGLARGLGLGLTLALAGCRAPAVSSEAPQPAARGAVSDDSASDDSASPASAEDAPWVSPSQALLARVGEVSLPRTEFDLLYALKIKKYTDRGREPTESTRHRYRRSIALRLIHHERLRQRVTALGLEVDPKRVEARMQSQRRGIRDWPQHLERRGETEASLRAQIVAELRAQLILEHRGAVEPSRADIEDDYAKIKANWRSNQPRIRAAHILVPVPEAGPGRSAAEAEAEARAQARRIRALATAPGADFAALAREHSAGPSADTGGDIGIFTADRMDERFSKVAFAMKPGQISRPVKTKYGFHIIKVIGRWPPGELPLWALEDRIAQRLRMRALAQGSKALFGELAADYPVVHYVLRAEDLKAPKGPQEPSRRGPQPDPSSPASRRGML